MRLRMMLARQRNKVLQVAILYEKLAMFPGGVLHNLRLHREVTMSLSNSVFVVLISANIPFEIIFKLLRFLNTDKHFSFH